MKAIITIFFMLTIAISTVLAQAPDGIKYQAVARDASGEVLANQQVEITIAILQGDVYGTEVFSETHALTTNGYGLVTLNIGAVNPTDFATIQWANGPYFVQVSMDGNVMGVSQLLSVPYAKYADEAGNTFSGSFNDLADVPTNIDLDATDDFDGDYNSLINQPDLSVYTTTDTTLTEAEVDAMTGNNGYAMQAGLSDSVANIRADLAIVATSGDYADLSNTPDLTDTVNYVDQNALEDTASSLRNDLARKNNVLALDNTTAFTPDADYEPATKKYVDDNVGGSGHYVGELYGGGIVFYVDETGDHGLIVSLTDISTSAPWGQYSTTTGATSTWDGNANSQIIDDGAAAGDAVLLAQAHNGGSNNDWYLPAIDELNLLYNARFRVNKALSSITGATELGQNPYWSSTEYDNNIAWYFRFSRGHPYTSGFKYYTYYVRAVRAF